MKGLSCLLQPGRIQEHSAKQENPDTKVHILHDFSEEPGGNWEAAKDFCFSVATRFLITISITSATETFYGVLSHTELDTWHVLHY